MKLDPKFFKSLVFRWGDGVHESDVFQQVANVAVFSVTTKDNIPIVVNVKLNGIYIEFYIDTCRIIYIDQIKITQKQDLEKLIKTSNDAFIIRDSVFQPKFYVVTDEDKMKIINILQNQCSSESTTREISEREIDDELRNHCPFTTNETVRKIFTMMIEDRNDHDDHQITMMIKKIYPQLVNEYSCVIYILMQAYLLGDKLDEVKENIPVCDPTQDKQIRKLLEIATDLFTKKKVVSTDGMAVYRIVQGELNRKEIHEMTSTPEGFTKLLNIIINILPIKREKFKSQQATGYNFDDDSDKLHFKIRCNPKSFGSVSRRVQAVTCGVIPNNEAVVYEDEDHNLEYDPKCDPHLHITATSPGTILYTKPGKSDLVDTGSITMEQIKNELSKIHNKLVLLYMILGKQQADYDDDTKKVEDCSLSVLLEDEDIMKLMFDSYLDVFIKDSSVLFTRELIHASMKHGISDYKWITQLRIWAKISNNNEVSVCWCSNVLNQPGILENVENKYSLFGKTSYTLKKGGYYGCYPSKSHPYYIGQTLDEKFTRRLCERMGFVAVIFDGACVEVTGEPKAEDGMSTHLYRDTRSQQNVAVIDRYPGKISARLVKSEIIKAGHSCRTIEPGIHNEAVVLASPSYRSEELSKIYGDKLNDDTYLILMSNGELKKLVCDDIFAPKNKEHKKKKVLSGLDIMTEIKTTTELEFYEYFTYLKKIKKIQNDLLDEEERCKLRLDEKIETTIYYTTKLKNDIQKISRSIDEFIKEKKIIYQEMFGLVKDVPTFEEVLENIQTLLVK